MQGYKTLAGDAFPTAHVLEEKYARRFLQTKFLDELRLMKFMQNILDKPYWYNKVVDETIVAKWQAEAKEQNIRDEVVEYAIDELVHYAANRDDAAGIEPAGVDMVWKSDTLISDNLQQRFITAVDAYEKGFNERDYHPGSKERVINIVHPSMFCLVYGHSTNKNGEVVECPEYAKGSKLSSQKYQWLPSEFLVDEDGTTKIASYINSLPFDGGLYPIISEIFSLVLPLFERVLGELRDHTASNRILWRDGWYWWKHGVPYPPGEADNWGTEELERWESQFVPIPVPINNFCARKSRVKPSNRLSLRGHRLQVIVKIGYIELTPDKPDFDGGTWHVEGMQNERIVSTAIYYYDSENIQDDALAFRQAVSFGSIDDQDSGESDWFFHQDDTLGTKKVFGLDRGDRLIQEQGDIRTSCNRVLAFPNIYQHGVRGFSLQDKTKPGHRKILVFFLVDPTQHIISTIDVSPQNPAWHDHPAVDQVVAMLPVELRGQISIELGSTMTLDDAKRHRLKLMEERSVIQDEVTNEVFSRPFTMCEH